MTRQFFGTETVLKFTLHITRTVGVINLSQFLLVTSTALSWSQTFSPFTSFVMPALDKSCHRDNLIFRRDLQKLRHGGLPAGTIFCLKYRDSCRQAAPPPFTTSTAGPLGGIARKPETVYSRDFIMAPNIHPSTGIQSSANYSLTSKLHLFSGTHSSGQLLYEMTNFTHFPGLKKALPSNGLDLIM